MRMVCGGMLCTVFVSHAIIEIVEIWQIGRGGHAVQQGHDW